MGSGETRSPLGGERDAAVMRVQDAFAQGAISHQELELRLHAVLTAQTSEQMHAALGSLPSPTAGRVVKIVAMSGRIVRQGRWSVPSVLQIESDYGRVSLDFSRATFETPVVDLELQLRFGRAKIIVPAVAVVDLDGLQAKWKQPRYEVPGHAPSAGPLIRVSGSMEFGRLTVRHAHP